MNNAYVSHNCKLYMLSLIINIRYVELYINFRVSSHTSMLQGTSTYISFTVYLICYFMWSHSECILPSLSVIFSGSHLSCILSFILHTYISFAFFLFFLQGISYNRVYNVMLAYFHKLHLLHYKRCSFFFVLSPLVACTLKIYAVLASHYCHVHNYSSVLFL